jgi:hypothetical protein
VEATEELTMPLLDMQHSVNGLVMGAPTVIRLDDVTGMGVGPVDEKKYPIGGANGVRWGRERRRGNLVTFEGAIVAPGQPDVAWATLTALRVAFSAQNILGTPNATVDWIRKMPGEAEIATPGRPRSLDAPTRQLRLGLVPFVATFECKVPM